MLWQTKRLCHNLLQNAKNIIYIPRYILFFSLQFTHLPAHSWHKMPLMKSLDISWNPIRVKKIKGFYIFKFSKTISFLFQVLTKESFYGLVRLQLLRVQYLPDLKRFDGDSLAHISYLTKLYIQSWPSIEKYKVRTIKLWTHLLFGINNQKL